MYSFENYPRMAIDSQNCTGKKLTLRENQGKEARVKVYQEADFERLITGVQLELGFEEKIAFKDSVYKKGEDTSIKSLAKKTSLFNYRGAIPYFFDGLTMLIAEKPSTVQSWLDDYYRAHVQWDYLAELATGGDSVNRRRFHRATCQAYLKPPNLYLDAGAWEEKDEAGNVTGKCNHGFVLHPIAILSMERLDKKPITRKEARLGANPPERKDKEGNPIHYTWLGWLDIIFWKPLFEDCFKIADGGSIKGRGYVHLDGCLYSNFFTTWREERNCETFRRLYNPSKARLEKKDHIIFWRGILYFLNNLSSNPQAETLTREGEKLAEMLASIDPGQLGTDDKIKNKADVMVLIDQCLYLFNAMARRGYCERVAAVPTFTTWQDGKDGLKAIIRYARDTPRAAIKPYSSTYMEEVLLKNEPLGMAEYGEDE